MNRKTCPNVAGVWEHQRRVPAVAWLKVNYTLGADYWTDERLEGCAVTSSAPCIAGGGRGKDRELRNRSQPHRPRRIRLTRASVGPSQSGRTWNTRNNRQIGTVGRDLVALQPFKLSNTVSRICRSIRRP